MKIDLKDEIVKFLEAPLRELGVEIADLNLSVYKNETTLKRSEEHTSELQSH